MIELGVVPDEPPAGPPPPPRRWRPLFGAVAGVLLVLLGGAAPVPRPSAPVIVTAELGERTQVRAGRLYVIGMPQPVGSPQKRQTIRAYALPDARPLYEQTVAVTGEIVDIQPAGDLLLILERDYDGAEQTTIAVRPGAAEPLWRRPGILIGLTPGGPAVFGASNVGDEVTTAVEWRGVDLATGEIRWTVRKAPGERAAADSYGGAPRLLYVLRAGRLTAYDTRDGRPAGEVALPGIQPSTAVLWPLAGRVVVSGDAGTTVLDAGLTVAAHTARSLRDYLTADDCGELICVYGADDSLAGLDPRTLEKRWSVRNSGYSLWLGGYLYTLAASDAAPRITRADPVTGRAPGRLDGWQFTPGTGPAVYLRHEERGRVWFGELDQDRFRVRPLVAAEGVTAECQIAGEVLICRKINGGVGVWRLR
jgi:hypothetical protein